MKNKRLLESLSFIDDKYVLEAEPKTKKHTRANASSKTIKRVACLVIIFALSLYLFIPITDKGPKLTAYEDFIAYLRECDIDPATVYVLNCWVSECDEEEEE